MNEPFNVWEFLLYLALAMPAVGIVTLAAVSIGWALGSML